MPARRRRRAKARPAKPLLSSVLGPFRALFVVGFVAAARALGGPPKIPDPPKRNLPVELDRKR